MRVAGVPLFTQARVSAAEVHVFINRNVDDGDAGCVQTGFELPDVRELRGREVIVEGLDAIDVEGALNEAREGEEVHAGVGRGLEILVAGCGNHGAKGITGYGDAGARLGWEGR